MLTAGKTFAGGAERRQRKRQALEVALRNYYQLSHLNLVQNVLFKEIKIVTSISAEGVISLSIRACLRTFPEITQIF